MKSTVIKDVYGEIERLKAVVRKESFMELGNFKNRWEKAVRADKCWVDPFQYAT
ncbi:hypothetical protein OROMI_008119 [Orobanche minor]